MVIFIFVIWVVKMEFVFRIFYLMDIVVAIIVIVERRFIFRFISVGNKVIISNIFRSEALVINCVMIWSMT